MFILLPFHLYSFTSFPLSTFFPLVLFPPFLSSHPHPATLTFLLIINKQDVGVLGLLLHIVKKVKLRLELLDLLPLHISPVGHIHQVLHHIPHCQLLVLHILVVDAILRKWMSRNVEKDVR